MNKGTAHGMDEHIIETLQGLRKQCEFWNRKYYETKNYRDYSLFQHYFKGYMQLIDSGGIPRSVIEQISNGEPLIQYRGSASSLASPQDARPSGTFPSLTGLLPREESLLTLFEKPEDVLALRDIQKQSNFSKTHLRNILKALVRKRRLKEEKVKGHSVWKRRCI